MSMGQPRPTEGNGFLRDVAPIARVTLHEEVLSRLRDMIIEGMLPPGSRINEGQVGASLGVSRTPLREAIKTLVSEGLVEILPAKGAIVRRFDQRDVFHILEVIKCLEQAAARLLCATASDAELEALTALHDEMMRLYACRDRLACFKCNQNIHSGLVRASGNPVLAQMHEQLQSRIKRVRFVGNDRPDRWAGAVAEHEEMRAAWRARDGERLAAIIGLHLDRTMDRVRDAI
jgi:DNA-binding GntR family transcriptional regulator